MDTQGKTCESCKHFRRHYVRRGKNYYIPLAFGHCVEPRCRDKETETPACWRYLEKKEGQG